MLCCGYTLTVFPISIRLTSLALWQSNDCPSASKATLMNMDKYFMWIHYERLHKHNKAKHNKTVCIFLGIYCMFCWWHHNRVTMTSEWTDNCDANTWQVISNSLNIDFIHGDIHDWSCKKIMYVLSWRTVSSLTRVLFWCLFNKHQINTLVSADTVRHESAYIILSIFTYINSRHRAILEASILPPIS